MVIVAFDFADSEPPSGTTTTTTVAARISTATAYGAVLSVRPLLVAFSSSIIILATKMWVMRLVGLAASARLSEATVLGKASETAHIVRVPIEHKG